MGSEQNAPPGPRALWPVDLKLTHLDWNAEATLIHFQGQYLTICELDYNILQGEIQNILKARAKFDIGEFCLVEDVTSARWYRGRVQDQKKDLYDVFLIDHGHVLSVDEAHLSSCSSDLFILPPKIVCGFLSSVLLFPDRCHSVLEQYFSNLIGQNVTGYIQAVLPHKVLLLEAPGINSDLVRQGFGKHVDTDTFLLLIEMLTEAPLKQNIQPAPDLLIEKQRGQELLFKPTSLQGYEEILSSCRQKFKCGSRVTVRVSAAVRPELFYCQIADKQSELKELSSKLTAVCDLKVKINKQRTPDNLGMLCSVKGKDEKWYRGFVQHLPINSLVHVLFVDFGYFESVEMQNVQRLPPSFSLTPILAFPCALSGGNNEDEVLKTQQLGFLKAGLLGGLLDVEINKQELHLYHITILSVSESFIPTLVQSATSTKAGSSDSEKQSLPQNGHLYYETIMSEELEKTLEDEEIQVGSVFAGYMEHVQSPNHFWIRTEKRNEEFEKMMEKLSEHFSNVKLDENVLETPEPGMLCCAVYEEDMHYYRGVVVDILEHGAEVLFIDFGNIEKVPHNLIKTIPQEFADKSAFALCCSLVDIVPNDDLWTVSTSDSFRRLLSNKELQVHVIQMRKNKFDVDLYLLEGGTLTDQSISELLIATNQAQYGKNISRQFDGQTKDSTPAKKKIVEQINQSLRKSENLIDLTEETSTLNYENEKLKEPVFLKHLRFKPGCEFAVFCPLINSPSDFFCQRLNKVPVLEELMMKLQDHYSTHRVPLEPGTLCCVVKSPNQSQWCRGIITERQNGQAKVILADFGSSIQVKEESLQGLMPQFCNLEVQAFRCSLYNVIEPPGLGWTEEASLFLKRFVKESERNLKCKVISHLNVRKELCNVVDLYNTESNQSVSNLLLEHSLARVVTTTLSPVVFPESFVYSSYGLTVGSEEQVHVTHISSHFEVLCQLDKNTIILEEIDAKICKIQKKSEAGVGKLCLAKYFDGKWYRGIAYSVQSPPHLCVDFVDYGNSMIVEKKHVIFIPREATDLLYTPMQALKFILARVPRDLIFADVKEWLDTAALNKQVRAVVEAKGENGFFEVELFDGEISINEKLRELIQSLTPKPKIAVTFKTRDLKTNQKQNLNPMCQNKAKSSPASNTPKRTNYKNKPKSNSRNETARAAHSYIKKQAKKVTKTTNDSVSPAKPQTTPSNKVKIETEISQPEHPTVFQVSCLPALKLTEGLKIRSFVSFIDSLTCFFVQLSDHETNIFKMVDHLNSKVFRDTLKSTSGTILKVDDLILAEYEEDDALYRAVVKDTIGFCTFKVEFVDFGNTALLGREKMYLITKDFISQPRYSIPCCLCDSSIFEDTAAFADAVMNRPLMVEFICYKKSKWQVKVEILGAEATSVSLEAAAPKETAPSKDTAAHKETTAPKETMVPMGIGVPKETTAPKETIVPMGIGVPKETTAPKETMGSMDTVAPKDTTILKRIAAPKETALSKEIHIIPEVKRPTETKQKFKQRKTCTRKSRKKRVKADMSKNVIIIMPQTIQPGDTHRALVLSIHRSGDFYVRLAKSLEALAALETLIAVNTVSCKLVLEEDVKVGLQCIVQEQNGVRGHRAVVEEVSPSGCLVFLLDHGKMKSVAKSSLRQMSNLAIIPPFAVHCRFNLLKGIQQYSQMYFEALKTIEQQELELVFVNFSEEEQLWFVEMVMDELLIMRHALRAESAREDCGIACDSSPNADVPQKLAFAPVELNKEYFGFAAAVTTPFEFCVVLEDLHLMSQVSVLLEDIRDELWPLSQAHLVPGTGCLVKSELKNKWCRAEILQADSTLILTLVDYGHDECLSYENHSKLKKLPKYILDLPKVTYPCVLKAVMPAEANGQWTDEAAIFFQQCLDQRNLQIFFREEISDCQWKVDVLTNGVHLAKQLVDAGHATYMDPMLGLRLQELSCRRAQRHGSDECDEDLEDSSQTFEELEQIFEAESDSNLCMMM